MKKLSLFLIAFLIMLAVPIETANAEQSAKSYYAKINTNGVMLYDSPSTTSALFEIPESYFVEATEIVGNFFKVTYKDKEGYVLKSAVSLLDGVPVHPFADISYSQRTVEPMYAQASDESAIINDLKNVANITYYGKIADQWATHTSNVWYYSSINVGGQILFGYVYSGSVKDDLTEKILPNSEGKDFNILPEDVLLPSTSNFTSLSSGTKVLLIVAIAVPSLLILYFLIKPSKLMAQSKKSKKVKKEQRKVSHGDYYEFDESQL